MLVQVVLFLERVHKASAATQSLLQVSSKYATIVCEDPPPMKSAFDFAGLFKVFTVLFFILLLKLSGSIDHHVIEVWGACDSMY